MIDEIPTNAPKRGFNPTMESKMRKKHTTKKGEMRKTARRAYTKKKGRARK